MIKSHDQMNVDEPLEQACDSRIHVAVTASQAYENESVDKLRRIILEHSHNVLTRVLRMVVHQVNS